MKNITVAVPDDVYRAARVRAAERGTSVSTLVAEYLSRLASEGSRFSRLQDEQARIQQGLGPFRAAGRLGRNQVHERAVR